MVIDGSKFFTKILSVVNWSSLFLNFSQDLPGTVFEVSATALCAIVYINYGARNWAVSCRTAFPTSDSREMAFKPSVICL